METVGKEIIVLDFQKGFCAQFSTAICIFLGSTLGIPLSTTHCAIGSLAGLVLAGKMEAVKRVYLDVKKEEKPIEEDDKAEPLSEHSKVNMRTVKKILFWWGLTVPAAFSVAALICWLLLLSGDLRKP
jgi:phosphate/sulfate permease